MLQLKMDLYECLLQFLFLTTRHNNNSMEAKRDSEHNALWLHNIQKGDHINGKIMT